MMHGARRSAWSRVVGALTLALAPALTLGACGGGGPGDRREPTMGEAVAYDLMRAWELADTATLVALFRPDAVYDDFPDQTQYQGVEEIVGYLSQVHAWGVGVRVDVGNVRGSGDFAVAEWLVSAFQDGPVSPRLDADGGAEVLMNGVTVIELEGGRIVRAADYFDRTALYLQLGGRVEMPDGSIIELGDVP
ncbi:MAG: nuclear transport factor 2 family protein [Gemmatimonadota bacterium]|nr:nuclear transport factor 2 family protein [Gemmatimonadota bacterium]MDH5758303.1 nuclear transport factor 2 family protein [Gemmatimonadota bacterium]